MSETNAQESDGRRRRGLRLLTVALMLAAAAYGAYWGVHGRFHESTDDAYVAGNVVQISSQVAGAVADIYVEDTNPVAAGVALVQLDPSDARLAVEQAEAELGRAVREVRTLFANDAGLASQVAQRESELARASDDLVRRKHLLASGAVSREEIEHAAAAERSAANALQTAREQLAANRVQIAGTAMESHPNVARAAARYKEAALALERTTIRAPVAGYVAKRSVQAGQRVAPGMPLMAIVPLDALWVDANFKEVQLKHMRIGQPVKLQADIYGGGVDYTGRIVGLGAGTGSAFALLPAQNATGNWIKVVQRVPVRISIDAKELAQHPLRVGLSVTADVDTQQREGLAVAQGRDLQPLVSSRAYDDVVKRAEGRLKGIIAANLAPARL